MSHHVKHEKIMQNYRIHDGLAGIYVGDELRLSLGCVGSLLQYKYLWLLKRKISRIMNIWMVLYVACVETYVGKCDKESILQYSD